MINDGYNLIIGGGFYVPMVHITQQHIGDVDIISDRYEWASPWVLDFLCGLVDSNSRSISLGFDFY